MNRYEILLKKKPPSKKKKKKEENTLSNAHPYKEIIIGGRGSGKTPTLIDIARDTDEAFLFCVHPPENKSRIKQLLAEKRASRGFVEAFNETKSKGLHHLSHSIIRNLFFDEIDPFNFHRFLSESWSSFYGIQGIYLSCDADLFYSCIEDWRNGYELVNDDHAAFIAGFWKVRDLGKGVSDRERFSRYTHQLTRNDRINYRG